MSARNWGGTYAYTAAAIHRPASMAELQDIVGSADRIRVLGSRHSFTGIADAPELVELDELPGEVVVDRTAGTVSVPAAMRYGALADVLRRDGLALANVASLPHISIAGAVATASHGSGDANGNLATAVAALELVTSDGGLVRSARGAPDFEGFVVGLGALGAVTRISLDIEPAYQVRQRVFEDLSWDALYANFDAITSAGYSVSVFTRWGETAHQVWVKSRVADAPERVHDELFGARAATVDRHPIPGLDAIHCSPQLGVAGLWSDRLPHFRMGFTPSSGDEVQSEYLVPRRHALPAIDAVRTLGDRLQPLVQVSEVRTVAADPLWLSPQYGRDTVGIHFTWVPDEAALGPVIGDLEAALAPFDARPHWGKLFLAEAPTIAALYERLPDFRRLAEQMDPRRAFRNPWLDSHVLGGE